MRRSGPRWRKHVCGCVVFICGYIHLYVPISQWRDLCLQQIPCSLFPFLIFFSLRISSGYPLFFYLEQLQIFKRSQQIPRSLFLAWTWFFFSYGSQPDIRLVLAQTQLLLIHCCHLRFGMNIIDLDQTNVLLRQALNFIAHIAYRYENQFFVAMII